MAESALVLVTGSAGRIGQAAVQELRARQRPVRGFDRVPTPGLQDGVVGNLTDPAAIGRAMTGVGTLIHLAATPDDDDFFTQLMPNNVAGVYNVLEAARAAGVGRMILASSGQVVWWQRQSGPYPIRTDTVPTPRYWYAVTKLFLEGAGRSFAEKFGMDVLVVRLGWCPRTPEQVEEIKADDWAKDVYLSPADAGRFFARAVEAPAGFRYAVLYATSKPARQSPIDLDAARQMIGYEPQETWPQGIDVVLGTAPPQG